MPRQYRGESCASAQKLPCLSSEPTVLGSRAMRMRHWALVLGLSACSDDLVKPDAPGQNDPAYRVDGVGAFYVVNNAASTVDQTMTVFVTVPSGTDEIAGFIGDV